MTARRMACVLCALALCAVGCAHYSTSGGLVGGIRTLGVPVAESRVAEFDIAEALSEHTVEAYARDGRLRVVDEESADALLELVVLNIEDRPFTYTASEQTEQYRFLLSVRGRLVRSLDEEVLIDFAPIEGWATYDAALSDAEGRDLAVEKALEMVVEELVDRSTSSW
ncbi:MAG: LPS assembly lipoprotein LptE [Candidatus Latescibacterota bacterium]